MDRNNDLRQLHIGQRRSLSARRAWIEILVLAGLYLSRNVALRKESVDRNYGQEFSNLLKSGRSPQGERG